MKHIKLWSRRSVMLPWKQLQAVKFGCFFIFLFTSTRLTSVIGVRARPSINHWQATSWVCVCVGQLIYRTCIRSKCPIFLHGWAITHHTIARKPPFPDIPWPWKLEKKKKSINFVYHKTLCKDVPRISDCCFLGYLCASVCCCLRQPQERFYHHYKCTHHPSLQHIK